MPVFIDDRQVVESGSVITFNNRPVTFVIENLNVSLIFIDDPKVAGNLLQYKLIDNTHLNIECVNFNNTIGIGNTAPLSIGTLGTRRLYLNIRVYPLSDNLDKTIHYSFYLGEEVQS